MDFLGKHVIHVDSEHGELLFLKSAPTDSRNVVVMHGEPAKPPCVEAFIAGTDALRFIIDTGAIGVHSGALSSRAVRSLAARKKIRPVSSLMYQSASEPVSSAVVQGNLLAMGGFAIENPVFFIDPKDNILELGFWSRFAVTFDFPRQRILLAKAAGYGRPDRWYRHPGFRLVRDGDSVVIEDVERGGAAGRPEFGRAMSC